MLLAPIAANLSKYSWSERIPLPETYLTGFPDLFKIFIAAPVFATGSDNVHSTPKNHRIL